MKIQSELLAFFIDTSSDKGLIAVYNGGSVLGSQSFKSADSALPHIDALFRQLNLKPDQIDFIGVGMGPGSFTGVRVGVVVARSMAFALDLPLVGLSSLAIFSNTLPVLSDARVGGFWAQLPNEEPLLLSTEEAAQRLKLFPKLVTPDNLRLESKLRKAGYEGIVTEVSQNVDEIGVLLYQSLSSWPPATKTIGYPEILYLRATQAEIDREQAK